MNFQRDEIDRRVKGEVSYFLRKESVRILRRNVLADEYTVFLVQCQRIKLATTFEGQH